ncbi:MAG: hypothetical protein HUU22_00685 [Phycisphaerae bacterium]|nr:hypothetical protein [Phycisphaerae bacterium]NUQ44530.1 hypothetical protein [Phycisphaerae bacterium]
MERSSLASVSAILRTFASVPLFCCCVIALPVGCVQERGAGHSADTGQRSDRPAPFRPSEQYPGWAFDAPEYVRPISEPMPVMRERRQDPLHYFVNRRLVHIRRPQRPDTMERDQIELFVRADGETEYTRIGFFGLGQSFFPYEAPRDGDFAIRFLGPQQPAAEDLVIAPDRVYHVDTTLPEVELSIEPALGLSIEAGQVLTLSWRATDRHLIEKPVQIAVQGEADDWRMLGTDLPADGSRSYTVPALAADRALQFRIEAMDRAGNVGVAFSDVLDVVPGEGETAPNARIAMADPSAGFADENVTSDVMPASLEQPVTDPFDAGWTAAEAHDRTDDVSAAEEPCPDEIEYVRTASTDAPADDSAGMVTHAADISDYEWPDRMIPATSDEMESPAIEDAPLAFAATHHLTPWSSYLAPVLPALEVPGDSSQHQATLAGRARPWQKLGANASETRSVWSLPRPEFLRELAKMLEEHWRAMELHVKPVDMKSDDPVVRTATTEREATVEADEP